MGSIVSGEGAGAAGGPTYKLVHETCDHPAGLSVGGHYLNYVCDGSGAALAAFDSLIVAHEYEHRDSCGDQPEEPVERRYLDLAPGSRPVEVRPRSPLASRRQVGLPLIAETNGR